MPSSSYYGLFKTKMRKTNPEDDFEPLKPFYYPRSELRKKLKQQGYSPSSSSAEVILDSPTSPASKRSSILDFLMMDDQTLNDLEKKQTKKRYDDSSPYFYQTDGATSLLAGIHQKQREQQYSESDLQILKEIEEENEKLEQRVEEQMLKEEIKAPQRKSSPPKRKDSVLSEKTLQAERRKRLRTAKQKNRLRRKHVQSLVTASHIHYKTKSNPFPNARRRKIKVESRHMYHMGPRVLEYDPKKRKHFVRKPSGRKTSPSKTPSPRKSPSNQQSPLDIIDEPSVIYQSPDRDDYVARPPRKKDEYVKSSKITEELRALHRHRMKSKRPQSAKYPKKVASVYLSHPIPNKNARPQSGRPTRRSRPPSSRSSGYGRPSSARTKSPTKHQKTLRHLELRRQQLLATRQ